MSESKKTRTMSVKGFLFKASGKVSAEAFLQAHRVWLETGEVAEVSSPILRMLDEKQILPTPALELLSQAILTYHLRMASEKAERQLLQNADPSSHTSKPWLATVYNAKGEVVQNDKEEDLSKFFQLASDADRWVDLRLVEGASDNFAVIEHARIMRADGTPISTTIMRGDALARILKAKKHPFSKRTGTDSRMSFGVKSKPSRSVFSHG